MALLVRGAVGKASIAVLIGVGVVTAPACFGATEIRVVVTTTATRSSPA